MDALCLSLQGGRTARRRGLLRDFLPLRPSVLHPSVTDRNAVMLIRRYKLQIILHLSRGTLTASCEVEGARAEQVLA